MLPRAQPPAIPFQSDLFAQGQARIGHSALERRKISPRSWLGYAPRWLLGADALMAQLQSELSWRQEKRMMYERWIKVPRLTASLRAYGPKAGDQSPAPRAEPDRSQNLSPISSPVPSPVPSPTPDSDKKNKNALPRDPSSSHLLSSIHRELEALLQRRLQSSFAAFYRDAQDSVAWHRDRVDHEVAEHHSAILSLGGPRTLKFRPHGEKGGRSFALTLDSGDLLVMGGAVQHEFEHCIPKCRYAAPRIALIYFEGEIFAGTSFKGEIQRASVTSDKASAANA